jgi:uncharacterized protein YbcI
MVRCPAQRYPATRPPAGTLSACGHSCQPNECDWTRGPEEPLPRRGTVEVHDRLPGHLLASFAFRLEGVGRFVMSQFAEPLQPAEQLQPTEQDNSPLMEISTALVRLHKEQFGRGPTMARTHFAGPDALVCVLENALLPAERKLVEMGDDLRVRETRMAFQVATTKEFIDAVERILHRKVRAFLSACDAVNDVVFENYVFESCSSESDGAPSPIR